MATFQDSELQGNQDFQRAHWSSLLLWGVQLSLKHEMENGVHFQDSELYFESGRVPFGVLLSCFLTLNVASTLVVICCTFHRDQGLHRSL